MVSIIPIFNYHLSSMATQELHFPYSWEERRPLYHKGIFFVPSFYFEHDRGALPPFAELFQNDHPISMELCSGNGEWVIQQALSDRGRNWISVEKKFCRVKKIWSKMRQHNLKNLLLVRGEAEDFLAHYLPDRSCRSIYINFPDPWPKERHAKNRLIKQPFIDQMRRILSPEGRLLIVTDDIPYTESIIDSMHKSQWQSRHPEPFFITSMPGYGSSFFERLWKDKGKEIRYMEFYLK